MSQKENLVLPFLKNKTKKSMNSKIKLITSFPWKKTQPFYGYKNYDELKMRIYLRKKKTFLNTLFLHLKNPKFVRKNIYFITNYVKNTIWFEVISACFSQSQKKKRISLASFEK